jgi:hypothetical protein
MFRSASGEIINDSSAFIGFSLSRSSKHQNFLILSVTIPVALSVIEFGKFQ